MEDCTIVTNVLQPKGFYAADFAKDWDSAHAKSAFASHSAQSRTMCCGPSWAKARKWRYSGSQSESSQRSRSHISYLRCCWRKRLGPADVRRRGLSTDARRTRGLLHPRATSRARRSHHCAPLRINCLRRIHLLHRIALFSVSMAICSAYSETAMFRGNPAHIIVSMAGKNAVKRPEPTPPQPHINMPMKCLHATGRSRPPHPTRR